MLLQSQQMRVAAHDVIGGARYGTFEDLGVVRVLRNGDGFPGLEQQRELSKPLDDFRHLVR